MLKGIIIENSNLTYRNSPVRFLLAFIPIKIGDFNMGKPKTPFSLR